MLWTTPQRSMISCKRRSSTMRYVLDEGKTHWLWLKWCKFSKCCYYVMYAQIHQRYDIDAFSRVHGAIILACGMITMSITRQVSTPYCSGSHSYVFRVSF